MIPIRTLKKSWREVSPRPLKINIPQKKALYQRQKRSLQRFICHIKRKVLLAVDNILMVKYIDKNGSIDVSFSKLICIIWKKYHMEPRLFLGCPKAFKPYFTDIFNFNLLLPKFMQGWTLPTLDKHHCLTKPSQK